MPTTEAAAKRPAVHVLAAMSREAWAITPEALETMLDVAGRVLASPDAVLRRQGEDLNGASWRAQVRDGVAIIPVSGPIFRHANLMTSICGATSVEILAQDIATAADDPAIKGIILDVDSPGGQVTGINELAGQIRAACAKKRVVAYAGGMMCSAAYWLGSAAGEVVADKTAVLGSIGVVSAYTDTSARDAAEGVKTLEIVSSQSPKKRLVPTTKEGRAEVQGIVDGLADVFVSTVAANRGTTPDDVLENFGQGGVLLAGPAVAAGMADRLGSLEDLISEIAAGDGHKTPAVWPQAEEANMPESKTPLTAEAVNAEWLAANRPDVVASIANDAKATGAADERARIKDILALGVKGHDALVASAMFDKPTDAAGLALAVLEAEKTARATMAADMEADAGGAAVSPSAPPSDPSASAEDDALIGAAVSGLNLRR